MTPADLQAYVDADAAYKRRDATIAQMTLLLNAFPTSNAIALAKIALAAIACVNNSALAGVCDEDILLYDALRDAGLLDTTGATTMMKENQQ